MCRGRSIQLSCWMGSGSRWFFGAGSPDSPCSSHTPHCCSPPISSLSSFLDSFSSGSNQQNIAQVNSWCQQCICKIRVSPMYALAGYNAQWANKLANICSIEWAGLGSGDFFRFRLSLIPKYNPFWSRNSRNSMLWNTQVRLQNYAIYREEPLPTLLVVQSYFYCLTQINISLFWLLLVCCCLEGLLERTDKTGAGLAPPCFYSRCGKVQAAVIQTNPINWRQCTAMQGSTKL